MKARAIKRGFLGGVYRRPGDEFDCPSNAFSSNWMIKLEKGTKPFEAPPKDEHVPLEIPSLMNKEPKKKSAPKKQAAPKKNTAS